MDRYQNLGIKASIFGDPLGNRGEYSKGIFYSGRRRYLYNENSQLPPMEPPRDMMTNKQKKKSCIQSTDGVPLIQRLDFKRAVDPADRANSKRSEQKKKNFLVIATIPTSSDEWTLKFQAGCKFWVHNRTGETTTRCPFSSDPSALPSPLPRVTTPTQRSLFNSFASPVRTKSSESPPVVSRNSPQSASPQSQSQQPQRHSSEELVIFLNPEEDLHSGNSNGSPQESLSVNERDEEEQGVEDVEEGTGALVYDNSDYQDLMRALDDSLSLSPKKKSAAAHRRGTS